MSQRPQNMLQSHLRGGCQEDVLIPKMDAVSLPIHSGGDAEVLAAIAATHVPALSDDLFNVIRAIVPPPPPVNVSLNDAVCGKSNECSKSVEELYTRRPTEKSLLKRLHGQISLLEETKINIEELYIQIIEPKKYSHENDVKNSILQVIWKWPTHSAVLEQTFACLVCMSVQCTDLCLPLDAVTSVLQTMKTFPKNETIQRLGIKLLKNKKILSIVDKVDVACMTFDSLCFLPGMDDIMISAEYFIQELNPLEKSHIRSHKKYVEMLLNFPNRRNDKITVCLCWSALDTLIMLAECDSKWDVFIDIGGKARLQMLSLRPELEGRCKILLNKVFPSVSTNVVFSELSPIRHEVSQADQNSSYFTQNLYIEVETPNPRLLAKDIPRGLSAGHNPKADLENNVKNQQVCSLKLNMPPNIEINPHIIKILPVDDLITRKPPTPPLTEGDMDDDVDGQFSDEECMQANDSPLSTARVFCSPSPSYSPPPETSLSLEDERLAFRELLNGGNGSNATLWTKNEQLSKCESPMAGGSNTISKPSCNVTGTRNPNPVSNSMFCSVFHCFICNESKGKQPLLMRQLKQISHCLLQPCNSLLLNCLKSKLCEHHSL